MALTPEQRARYGRNLLVPGLGPAGQERLFAARVLVVGLGGLGSPAALYLTAAGVGHIGLLDSDTVELSNLQRQVLHGTPDLGRPKTESARDRLWALNPEAACETMTMRLDGGNAGALVRGFDAVVEATDSMETKFLLNDVCCLEGRPLATAGILALSGHGAFIVPGRTACLRCAFPEMPDGEPTTGEFGVLGAVAGTMGCVEALETVRYLAGLWQPAPNGTLLLHGLDGERMRLSTVRVPRRAECRCAAYWSET